MAITVNALKSKLGFIDNAISADVSGCEEIHAAVSGKKIKIRSITVNSDAAITITIGEGETTGAVTSALLGPVAFAANQTIQWSFNPLLELTAAKSLTIDASGAGNVCVIVQGVINND